MSEEKDPEKKFNPDDVWMIRPCDQYHEEYKECRRWGARQFQTYVHGEPKDCNQWLRDRNNCLLWQTAKNVDAASDIIASERQRRKERLLPYLKNTVWEKRDKPLEDWNKPLPAFMERTKFSYITREMELERGVSPLEQRRRLLEQLCVLQ